MLTLLRMFPKEPDGFQDRDGCGIFGLWNKLLDESDHYIEETTHNIVWCDFRDAMPDLDLAIRLQFVEDFDAAMRVAVAAWAKGE